jgi:predicted amidohydrolase YtcJ
MDSAGPEHTPFQASAPQRTLLLNSEVAPGEIADILIDREMIVAIGADLRADGAMVLDAGGACLLPGLHDHHIHLAASSAALASIPCGPPQVVDAKGLANALAGPGDGWLRGVGYHESVAGLPDRHVLDTLACHRPLRIQHRSGRMWLFNTAGLECLLESGVRPPPGLQRAGGEWTGRLFDEDAWLRQALDSVMPVFTAMGHTLAASGITGISDLSVANGRSEAEHFRQEMARGALPQRVVLAGSLDLPDLASDARLSRGPFKLHLHEAGFPDWDETVSAMRQAHEQGRGVAVHCVSESELVFTVALFREVGTTPHDRIEHGSVIPDALIEHLAALGLPIVVQPGFVAERGDRYLADIAPAEWPWLYRLASLRAAGLVLAGGSDAPYTGIDPWAAMRASVERRTAAGRSFGPYEALTPEQAMALYLADPHDLRTQRRIQVGAAADLCLLDQPWWRARQALSLDRVRATICAGRLVYLLRAAL